MFENKTKLPKPLYIFVRTMYLGVILHAEHDGEVIFPKIRPEPFQIPIPNSRV